MKKAVTSMRYQLIKVACYMATFLSHIISLFRLKLNIISVNKYQFTKSHYQRAGKKTFSNNSSRQKELRQQEKKSKIYFSTQDTYFRHEKDKIFRFS